MLNSGSIHVTSVTDPTQLAALRQQQLQKLSSGGATTSPRHLATLTVQEMVATVGGNRTVVSTSAIPVSRTLSNVSASDLKAVSGVGATAASPQQSPSSPVQVQSPVLSGKAQATKTISATQLALYRHQQQQLLRQQQIKLLKSQQQAGGSVSTVGLGSSTPPKVSIAVTPPQSPSLATSTSQVTTVPRMQQVVVKSGRAVTESEMVALLKRQQAAKVVQAVQSPTSSGTTLTTAQILTSIQVKALNAQSVSAQGDISQQVKPITHQQLLARAGTPTKLSVGTQQKVAQYTQVPGKQLIVQSAHKTLPTTVTVQQIQQVMKQVRPGHVVVAGAGRAGLPGTVSQVLTGTLKQQAILAQVSGIGSGVTRNVTGTVTAPSSIVSAPLITIPPPTTQPQPNTQPGEPNQ